MTPTQRTLALLRQEGWICQVVEKWNAHARKRVDLFGIIDIVALKPGIILGVQTTSGAGHSARIAKARAEPRLRDWLCAGGRFEVISWAKRGKRGKRKLYQVRKQRLTLRDLDHGVLPGLL